MAKCSISSTEALMQPWLWFFWLWHTSVFVPAGVLLVVRIPAHALIGSSYLCGVMSM